MTPNQIICGDNLEVMRTFPANYFDTVITDPPYGLGFMGKDWDTFKEGSKPIYYNEKVVSKKRYHISAGKMASVNKPIASAAAIAGSYDHSRNAEFQQWFTIWAKEVLRIAKPGAIMLIFGGTRTYHRLTCAIEDAGWQIRDCMMWLYGSGFPKSHDISKAIDKAKGAERKKGKIRTDGRGKWELKMQREKGDTGIGHADGSCQTYNETTPATDLAKLWDGWGTALKPGWEPIIVAMKPLEGTFAQNAEKHVVAGLNIDGGRIEGEIKSGFTKSRGRGGTLHGVKQTKEDGSAVQFMTSKLTEYDISKGRWPANVILDEEAAAMLDEQSGDCKTGNLNKVNTSIWGTGKGRENIGHKGSSGGASRYYKIIMVDTDGFSGYDAMQKGDLLCGNTLENQKIVGMLNGVIKAAERCLEDAVRCTCGLNITGNWLKDTRCITKTLIQLTTELKTLLPFLGVNIVFCTDAIGKTIERLADVNIEDVNDAKNIGRWKDSIKEVQELIRDIAKIVAVPICKNTTNDNPVRFKYCAKASRAERNAGLNCDPQITDDGRKKKIDNAYLRGKTLRQNHHPTVKPLKLMEYLCTLTKTPTRDIVLDCFGGSGTTAMACVNTDRDYIVIEKDPEYVAIAEKRVAWAKEQRAGQMPLFSPQGDE